MRRECLATLLIALLAAAAMAADPAAAAAPTKQQYILVLKNKAGVTAPTDAEVGKVGGTVDARLNDRILISIPDVAVAAMKAHKSTNYLQRVVLGAAKSSMPPMAAAESARTSSVPGPRPPGGHRVTTSAQARTLSGATWSSGIYTYDGSGNITSIGPDWNGYTNTYGYDGVARLVSATINTPATAGQIESYTYDVFGNMTARNGNNPAVMPVPGAIPVNAATNRMTGIDPNTGQPIMTIAYDAAGDVTALGPVGSPVTYKYDAEGMLLERDSSYMQELYVYTPDGQRIGTRSGSDGDTWTWSLRDDDGKVLREYKSSQQMPTFAWLWLEDYAYRDGLLLGAERVPEEGGRRQFHLDHLGSPRLITGDSGEMIAQRDFRLFGTYTTNQMQETSNGYDREEPMSFTGHERDLASTSAGDTSYEDYMHARYYTGTFGRFLSVDPELGSPYNPQSWNRYSYVLNNPVNSTDPTGRCEQKPGDLQPCSDMTITVEANAPSKTEEAVEVAANTIDGMAFDAFRMLGGGNLFMGMLHDDPVLMAKGVGQQLMFAAPGGIAAGLRPLAATGSLVFPETSALANASQAAFAAADTADAFTVSAKHLPGAGGRYAKFAEGVNPNEVLREALGSGHATFLPNSPGSFQVVTNVGRVIGSRGETAIKVVMDFSGKVWTWYPVK